MTLYFEPTINGKDCAVSVSCRVFDTSFDHEFGTESQTEIDIDFEDCEGCSRHEAIGWIDSNRDTIEKKFEKMS